MKKLVLFSMLLTTVTKVVANNIENNTNFFIFLVFID